MDETQGEKSFSRSSSLVQRHCRQSLAENLQIIAHCQITHTLIFSKKFEQNLNWDYPQKKIFSDLMLGLNAKVKSLIFRFSSEVSSFASFSAKFTPKGLFS